MTFRMRQMGYLRFLAFAAFSLIFLLHLQPAHGAKLDDIIAAAQKGWRDRVLCIFQPLIR